MLLFLRNQSLDQLWFMKTCI
uniref:Uncharacterized protein n=1 Tax=Anguilla anguilla TaxID=7936 RepID=A0A0E9XU98_ANGAN